MKSKRLRALLLGILLVIAALPPAYGMPAWSSGLRLRRTLTHMGANKEEHITVKESRLEGPGAGPKDRFLDTSNLGDYQLAIADPATNEILHSRGFNSAFIGLRTDYGREDSASDRGLRRLELDLPPFVFSKTGRSRGGQ